MRSKTLEFWLRKRKPIVFNFAEDTDVGISSAMRQAARQYRFFSLFCHGQMDADRQHISYVVFNRNTVSVGERDCTIIAHLMPQLHASLVRLSEHGEDAEERGQWALRSRAAHTDACTLSLRQKQVLYLLGIGKTNWEIGKILDTSIDNVKYHVKRLNATFGTSCRVTLTTTASRRGILPGHWPT